MFQSFFGGSVSEREKESSRGFRLKFFQALAALARKSTPSFLARV